MGRFLIWCSGVDRTVLATCPTDRSKYVGLGGAVLTTATMAYASFIFALTSVFGVDLRIALLGGLVWAAAIFNLDRWLVSALRRRPTFWANVGTFAPRLLLAVFIGIVISEPVVLRIFEPEIRVEMAKARTEENRQAEQRLVEDSRFADLPAMRQRVTELRTAAAGGVDPAAILEDPEVVALTEQLAAKEAELSVAEQQAICETGGECGTMRPGEGPVARQRLEVRDRLRSERDQLSAALQARKEEVEASLTSSADENRADAQAELDELLVDIEALEVRRASEVGSTEAATAGSTGMLARMEGLHSLSGSSRAVFFAQWALRLFIILIDVLPVLIKFLMSLLPPTPYDRALERVEAEMDDQRDEAAEIDREIARLRAEVPLVEARSQHRLEVAMADSAAEKLVQAQDRVYDYMLELWEQEQRKAIAADPAAYIS